MTTLQNRINNIEREAEKRESERLEKNKKEVTERKELLEKIQKLSPRIKDLITLANTCFKNGIILKEDSFYNTPNKETYFFTDSFYHWLGFNKRNYFDTNSIVAIGIANGGACGSIDMFVTEDGEVKAFTNDFPHSILNEQKIHTSDLQYFVREFDEFERRFLAYIDKLGK